ncbi:hypothetical protein MMYC01_204595 [Madurella mycetomatis]|uniref:Uncharacterized protein n=1 Tax=Madurella mycetomatis TaxID=100816 RepID=A0A175W5Z4_9PEZI|nr:hypothetical protein MMYC01_204595 [Madurella mycetomatis]
MPWSNPEPLQHGLPVYNSGYYPEAQNTGSSVSVMSANPSLLEYSNYTLGVHASVLPQTVFRPGEALQNLPLALIVENDSSDTSKLYTSGMLAAMALADEPDQSLWNATSGTQAEPEPVAGETVSPKMLRIRQTPSPSSSRDSIHASFLADAANRPLPAVDPLPSQTS